MNSDIDATETSAEIVRSEIIQPGPAEGLAGLLGVPLPDLEHAGLPLLWHWLYLLERPAQSDLGLDGHAVRGVIPATPGPGRRRMWARGRVRLHRGSLRTGVLATRRTLVGSVEEKVGRSGRLTFVGVDHVISQEDEVVVEERQELVYRAAELPDRAPGQPWPQRGATTGRLADGWVVEVTPTLLFQFSALTYNAHRIHFDRDYARDVEGYAGLVVHGPLQAVIMAEAARARGLESEGPMVLDYRLKAPLLDHEGLVALAERRAGASASSEWDLSVTDLAGRGTAAATLRRT